MMANGSDLDEEPAAPQRPSHANLPPTSARNLPVEEVSLSLSDYITQVAAEEGLIFLPKPLGWPDLSFFQELVQNGLKGEKARTYGHGPNRFSPSEHPKIKKGLY